MYEGIFNSQSYVIMVLNWTNEANRFFEMSKLLLLFSNSPLSRYFSLSLSLSLSLNLIDITMPNEIFCNIGLCVSLKIACFNERPYYTKRQLSYQMAKALSVPLSWNSIRPSVV